MHAVVLSLTLMAALPYIAKVASADSARGAFWTVEQMLIRMCLNVRRA